jgi:hypothetical protein
MEIPVSTLAEHKDFREPQKETESAMGTYVCARSQTHHSASDIWEKRPVMQLIVHCLFLGIETYFPLI